MAQTQRDRGQSDSRTMEFNRVSADTSKDVNATLSSMYATGLFQSQLQFPALEPDPPVDIGQESKQPRKTRWQSRRRIETTAR